MEDLLALYAEPYDPRDPVVCVAERPYPRVSEVRPPLPATPGHPVRYDDASRREGTCHRFMRFPPVQGWRPVKGTDRRTAKGFAPWRQELVDVHVPQATLMRVVLDHLHTHTPAA